MLLRKTIWFWKSGLEAISFVLMFIISGCSDAPPEEDTVSESGIDVQTIPEESHSERITEKEKDRETSTDSAYWFIPQSGDCLISEEEKEQLQSTVLSAAESVKEIYKNVIIADAANDSSGVSEFSSEQRKTVVEQLGKAGLISVEEDTNMRNPEGIERFYADYLLYLYTGMNYLLVPRRDISV